MFKSLIIALSLGARYIQAAPQKYDDIISCLASSNVPQDYPGSAEFSQDVIPYNLRLNFTPVALPLYVQLK
jgi:hypothetical protein